MENQSSTHTAKQTRNGKRKLLKQILTKSPGTQLFIYNKLRDILEKRKQSKEEFSKLAKKLGVKIGKLELR